MHHAWVKYFIKLKFDRQADFAAAVNSNESRVSRALRGRIKLRPDEAQIWAEKIGCDTQTLAPITRPQDSE